MGDEVICSHDRDLCSRLAGGGWGDDSELLADLLDHCQSPSRLFRAETNGESAFDASGSFGLFARALGRSGVRRLFVFPGDGETASKLAGALDGTRALLTDSLDEAASCTLAIYNLRRHPRLDDLARLAAILPEGARLVLTGMLLAHRERVRAVCEARGYAETHALSVDELVTLAFQRVSLPTAAPPTPMTPMTASVGVQSALESWYALAEDFRTQPNWRITARPLSAHEHGAERTISIEPSLTYGSGGSIHTRLSLAALAGVPGAIPMGERRVLDLGCGTGVLALGCVRLGARHVVGMDVDPRALAEARSNAARNALPSDVRFELCTELPPGQRYALVVANLHQRVLGGYLDRFAEMVDGSGAHLLVCGHVPDNHVQLVARLGERGFLEIARFDTLDGKPAGGQCLVLRYA